MHRSQYPEDPALKAAGALLAKPPVRNPVVVALTTTPTRVGAVEPAVRSLLNQSQPALIVVSIPDARDSVLEDTRRDDGLGCWPFPYFVNDGANAARRSITSAAATGTASASSRRRGSRGWTPRRDQQRGPARRASSSRTPRATTAPRRS